MREITVLDQNTIDKIAAGEVVERPASVAKELIENAIDASATAVTVEIRDGGCTLLRVTDNGAGIRADQVRLAFLRHATSKIRKVEDLLQIASLGFRGEALSSIAAVSRVECVTKTADDITGIRLRIDGGIERSFEEIGAPDGTTLIVRDLFFNTPARAKFLRSAVTEGNRVSTVVEELALSHPEISFKYIQNGKNVLYTSGNGSLKELVYQIFGRDTAKALLPLEIRTEDLSVRGFIGEPPVSRGNRSCENFFVNGRFIRSDLLSRAAEEGYRGFLMQHRFPFVLLYLELDGRKVDVNVHPAKMEVRFSDREEIFRTVSEGIRDALIARERIPEICGDDKKDEPAVSSVSAPEPFEAKRRAQELVREKPAGYKTVFPSNETRTGEPRVIRLFPVDQAESTAPAAPESPAPDQPAVCSAPEQQTLFDDRFLGEKARTKHRIIGQLFTTYFLVEYGDDLFIVDQHAAHEKVLYERLMRRHREKRVVSQQLFPAEILSPGRAEAELLRTHLDDFAALGFEIEPFGGGSFRMTAVPADLYSISGSAFLREVLDSLEEIRTSDPELLLDRLATMSCKAAVKGHDRLTIAEADALLDELMTLENPYNCPHGRPTIISMSRYELEKKFGRIV